MGTQLADAPIRARAESARCPLCGSVDAFPWLEKSGYRLFRCSGCEAGFVSPMPGRDEIERVYDAEYLGSSGEHGYGDTEAALRKQQARQSVSRRRLLTELGYSGRRAVELGCGRGWWLAALAKDHERVVGIEPMVSCREEAARAVSSASILPDIDALDATERFDLLSCFDVLEHLADPVAVFGKLRAHLAPGGYVMIVVPCLDHWTARLRPDAWDQIKPPEHLVYFGRDNLRAFVEREGLEVLHVGSAWNRWPRPLPFLPQFLQRPFRPLMKCFARYSARIERGIGDSVLLVARSPSE